jgi:hypothetical protein
VDATILVIKEEIASVQEQPMIKYGEVNPLNVHGLRRLTHCPPHFTRVSFTIRTSEKIISDWIYENLAGRFWFDDYYTTGEKGDISFNKCVGFELGSEASYFSMFLDKINKNIWN